jgi:hypothetical protein
MDSQNSALIYPEVLFDVIRVLEDKYPVGPSFVNSLSTLIEAVVIHDRIFLHSNYDLSANSPWQTFHATELAATLKREGILVEPTGDEFEEWLSSVGCDQDEYIKFLTNDAWIPTGFLADRPEDEEMNYRAFADIATYAPEVFSKDTLVEGPNDTVINLSALPLLKHGFTAQDLIRIEGYNRAIGASQTLSRSLGLHFYSIFQSTPHQIGSIKAANLKARSLFEELQTRILVMVDDNGSVGDDQFRRIDIPPLCQIVLEKCKGSRRALWDELLDLRERHKSLRAFLGAYESRWNLAETKGERRSLKAELNQAFENLAKHRNVPKHSIVVPNLGHCKGSKESA